MYFIARCLIINSKEIFNTKVGPSFRQEKLREIKVNDMIPSRYKHQVKF